MQKRRKYDIIKNPDSKAKFKYVVLKNPVGDSTFGYLNWSDKKRFTTKTSAIKWAIK